MTLAVAEPLLLEHPRRYVELEGALPRRRADRQRGIELAQDRLRPTRDRARAGSGAVELALAVDADGEDFLLVVLELTAGVGNVDR